METFTMTVPFTPGPWTIADGHDRRVHLIDDSRGHAVGEIVYADTRKPADARLIAAAPDLLAALEELIAEWDATHADEDHRTGYTLDTGGIRMAREAIARATGGEA